LFPAWKLPDTGRRHLGSFGQRVCPKRKNRISGGILRIREARHHCAVRNCGLKLIDSFGQGTSIHFADEMQYFFARHPSRTRRIVRQSALPQVAPRNSGKETRCGRRACWAVALSCRINLMPDDGAAPLPRSPDRRVPRQCEPTRDLQQQSARCPERVRSARRNAQAFQR
jgi:hypothetical protein